MRTTENPENPDSFAYLLRHIIGSEWGIQTRVAKLLGINKAVFHQLMVGHWVPMQNIFEGWAEILHSNFDLDRPFGDTGDTLRQAWEKKISLLQERLPERNLLWVIGGKQRRYIETIAVATGLPHQTLNALSATPERFTARWIQETLVPKLLQAFPDRSADIEKLRILSMTPRASAAVIKGAVKNGVNQVEADFKLAAGALLRELREANGHTIEELAAQIKAPLVLKNNPGILEKIEAGNAKVASSIYRDAITEICGFYEKLDPEKAEPYLAPLKQISQQLRPR